MAIAAAVWNARARLAPPLAVLGLAAAAWIWFGGAYPNFDAAYAVVWGDSIVAGGLPNYDTAWAPTPHPLATAIGALAAIFGHGAYLVVAAVAFVSFSLVVWTVYRLGREAYSWQVGLLAALIMATSYTLLSRTTATYFDVTAVALVLCAILLEVRRPRRGAAVFVLLALAGLQRPEAWLLAGAYWLYLAPSLSWRGRVRMALFAVAAPALWMLADLLVTGQPLFALTHTQQGFNLDHEQPGHWSTEALHASSETLTRIASTMVNGLRDILRLPVLVGSLAGAAFAVVAFRSRSWLLAASLLLALIAFLCLGVVGLPLLDRFLFLPAAMLALFFSLGALGWTDHRLAATMRSGRSGPRSVPWAIFGALLLVLLAASVPAQVGRLRDLRQGVQLRVRAVDDLDALAKDPRSAAVLSRCTPITFPNEQIIPFVAFLADRSPNAIVAAGTRSPRSGAYLEPRGQLLKAGAFLLPEHLRTARASPTGFVQVAANRSWILHAKACGVARGSFPAG